MDSNSEHNSPSCPSTAIWNKICVTSQTPMAMILTHTEIPVYQQNFPGISYYGLRKSTYISWRLLISTPEETRSINYLFLVFCGYWTNDYIYWYFLTSKDFFPSIPSYALRSISGVDSEKFLILDFGVDTEHLLQFLGFLRILLGTKLFSYSTAPTKPPYWQHQLN